MRPTCRRCLRPETFCVCAWLGPIPSRTRVVLLQHPREARLAICSARLTRVALQNAELHRGVSFQDHPRLREVVAAPGTALLFPGGVATEVAAADPPRALVVIDGTVLGVTRDRLLEELPVVARTAGVEARPFAAMSVAEVAALTGLSEEQAALAMRREYDEPFVVEGRPSRDPDLLARLDRAARGRGLRVTHGGRVHHLTGPADKGQAVRALVQGWPGGIPGDVVGLGDAANDRELLLAVDRPILMPRPDGSVEPILAARLRGRERAPFPGPAGWSAAVLAALAGEALPRVGE